MNIEIQKSMGMKGYEGKVFNWKQAKKALHVMQRKSGWKYACITQINGKWTHPSSKNGGMYK